MARKNDKRQVDEARVSAARVYCYGKGRRTITVDAEKRAKQKVEEWLVSRVKSDRILFSSRSLGADGYKVIIVSLSKERMEGHETWREVSLYLNELPPFDIRRSWRKLIAV